MNNRTSVANAQSVFGLYITLEVFIMHISASFYWYFTCIEKYFKKDCFKPSDCIKEEFETLPAREIPFSTKHVD